MITLFHDTMQARSRRIAFAAFALLLAILYDAFFWKQETGLGFFVFIVIAAGGFLALASVTHQLRQRWALLFLIPILILSFDVMLYENDFTRIASPILIFALAVFLAIFATLSNPAGYAFSLRQIPILLRWYLPLARIDAVYHDLIRWRKVTDSSKARKIAQGFLAALPLLLIFAFLFAHADAIFAQWFKDLFEVKVNGELVWRFVRTVILTALLSGFFYVLVRKDHLLGDAKIGAMRFDSTMMTVVLGLVNALFFVFVFIQFKYLFGSAEFVRMSEGLTYAQYARRGFFELAWVMVIAAGLLLAVYRSFIHHGTPRHILSLYLLLVLQVGVVAASALKRMNLYQDAYGFTVLRLYVEWFIYFVFIMLAVSGASFLFRWPFRNFFYASWGLGIAALTAVGSLNVDRLIARENVRRFVEEGKELDMAYLRKLSDDALPAMTPLFTRDAAAKLKGEIDSLHQIVLRAKDHIAARDSWREFHIDAQSVERAVRAYEQSDMPVVRKEILYEEAWARFASHRNFSCRIIPPGGSQEDSCAIWRTSHEWIALKSRVGNPALITLYREQISPVDGRTISYERVTSIAVLHTSPESIFVLGSSGKVAEFMPREKWYKIYLISHSQTTANKSGVLHIDVSLDSARKGEDTLQALENLL